MIEEYIFPIHKSGSAGGKLIELIDMNDRTCKELTHLTFLSDLGNDEDAIKMGDILGYSSADNNGEIIKMVSIFGNSTLPFELCCQEDSFSKDGIIIINISPTLETEGAYKNLSKPLKAGLKFYVYPDHRLCWKRPPWEK